METNVKALKAKVMLWTDLSYHDMEELDKIQSTLDLESFLSRVLEVDLLEPKKGVLLELYSQVVLFCRKQKYGKEQTSALLSIIKSVHEANIGTPLNNIEECLKYCKELLLCHSVRRPPFSINIFNSVEVHSVFKYIHNHYMRHFKLYKYIFTKVKLDLSFTYLDMMENFSVAGIKNVIEEGDASLNKDDSAETQDLSIPEPQDNTLGSTSELKGQHEV